MRRIATIPIIAAALCVISALGWSGPAQASSSQLTYQISDARAYGYKASIAQPVIQAAPKCAQNPDKYHCRDYDHKKNCPNKIAIGATALPPDPQPPEGVDGQHGGAGQSAGNGNSGVPQSSAVRLNRLFSDGALGREGNVLASNGVSSLQYVDLGSPPWNPEAHTETDAFSNLPKYEERCYETGSNGNYDPKASSHAKPGDSYAHMFSHSLKGPETVFFQAEDGIRYLTVTGVQTCALPIYAPRKEHDPHESACKCQKNQPRRHYRQAQKPQRQGAGASFCD